MAIADELVKLENNRAAIVTAINNKGGRLAENAGLSLCPDAINGLFGGSTPPPTSSTIWTGHVDENGLRYIGWNDEDIATLKTVICWDEADDDLYAVPQDHKDLWDACEKVTVDGRTMLAYSEIGKWRDIDFKLVYLPMVDFSSVTDATSYFEEKRWLIGIPKIDTSKVINFSKFLKNCYNLLTIPSINVDIATNISNMFSYCFSLRDLPEMTFLAATGANYMFYYCENLVLSNILNFPSLKSTYWMFGHCDSLVSPKLTFSTNLTETTAMFCECANLNKVEPFDTSNVSIANYMFDGCWSLVKCPLLDFSKVTSATAMFRSCQAMRTLPNINVSSINKIDEMFDGCTSLEAFPDVIIRGNNGGTYARKTGIREMLNFDMSTASDIDGMNQNQPFLRHVRYNFTNKVTRANVRFENTRNIAKMEFSDTCTFSAVTSSYNLFAPSSLYSIPKSCVDYTLVKQLCEVMLRGIPKYTANSYTMFFEEGSSVTDDADGTLTTMLNQCSGMKWAITNLSIIPYSA